MVTKSDNGQAVIEAKAELGGIGEAEFLTWGEASEVRSKRLFIPRYNKWVEFRDRIPLDEMARIQARFPTKTRESLLARFVDIMRYVMINPPVTDESERALRKADSALVTMILAEVLPDKEASEMQAALGES